MCILNYNVEGEFYNMIMEISALIAAIAFAVLVIYLIRTLLTAQQSLERVSSTLAALEQTVNGINGDLQNVVKNANEVTANVQQQLNKMTPLINSIENAGEALEEVTSAAKQVSVGFINGVRKSAARSKQAKAEAASYSMPEEQIKHDPNQTAHTYKEENTAKSGENWKTWVDLGMRAWQMYRSHS